MPDTGLGRRPSRGRPHAVLISTALLLAIGRSVVAAPDYWDPRLNTICGLYLEDKSATVPAGQGYWRLTRAQFENEQESGFNHHIYYKCLDINGNPIENQKVWASWSYTNETDFVYQYTKGAFDQYWGNFAMYVGTCAGTAMCGPSSPGPWPYNAYVDTAGSPRGYIGPSDKVLGMGMTNPQGTPCGAHVNFRLTWQWTLNSPPLPAIQLSPTSITRSMAPGVPPPPPGDSFTIRNAGGGTMAYTIGDNASWLSTMPTSGEVTGAEVDTIALVYDTANLAVGTYNAVITVSSPTATNSPQTIAVTLDIRPPVYLGDFDSDGDVDQQDFGHLQACITGFGVPASDECADAKLDGDIDIDQDDVQLFEACMNGPGNPPPATCIK